MEDPIFKIIFMDEAQRFIQSLSPSVRKKISYTIDRVQYGDKNAEFFKKIVNSEIWEFHTLYAGIAYRLFAFWDKENETIVVATHGIIKKTQKTPTKEIAKAEEIRKQYFKHKH